YPILLMPLRLETRWRQQERELWVRVYPDDCAVDSFEPMLSEVEITNGQRFWAGMLAGGSAEPKQRAAWRSLVSSHGAGRAAWITQQYRPLDNPAPANPNDVVLVIPTDRTPSALEMTALQDFWKAIWLADNDATKVRAAQTNLEAVVGAAQAAALVKQYVPEN